MRVDSVKFLSVGVLLLISTLTLNGAASKAAAIVKDVSFTHDGESLEVKIAATDETKYTHFELQHPHRLVVDFHGIQNTISFKEKKIEVAGLVRVRTSFFSDQTRKATRIVFDLSENAVYRLVDDGGGKVRIVFGPAAHAPLNQVAGPAISLENAAPALTVVAALDTPPLPAAPRLGSAALVAALPSLTSQIPAPALSLPAAVGPPANSPVMAAAESSISQQTPPSPAATQAPVQVAPAPANQPPQYTGEIISLDLKDYDIKDFFRLISEISGLNVVLDPNVNGMVTLKLTDVPWYQALDVVLRNNQLGAQLQGNVLRIATNATLQGEQTAQKNLRDAQEQAAPLVTRTFLVNYTTAKTLSDTLKTLLSPRGTIITDDRRNALIITDVPSQYTNLENMVKFMDTPQQQVEIEARLLQANKSFSRDIGNQIGLLIGQNSGNVLTGVPNNTSPFNRTPPPRVGSGGGLPLISDFPAAATSGLSFLLQPGGNILLDELIGAAEAKGTAKLLSRPRVTTQNNVAATIQQGTQIPVQTNVNNTITVQFTSFTLNLTVTPQITEAGTILLKASITNSQPDFARAVNGVPSVSTQSAVTQVLIPDGGTAVIGGILIDTDSVNVRQVPGLGNLPLIGTLFKDTNTTKSTSELLFFITPKIKALDSLSVLAPGEAQPVGQPQQR